MRGPPRAVGKVQSAMKIQIEITEKELRALILSRLRAELGDAAERLDDKDIQIEVKSQQNYKSEWERAAFRARVEVDR
jgi:hypothetical protein